ISVCNHEQVYIETYAFSSEGLSDAAGADDRHGLAGDFIAEQRMMRMPRAPLAGLDEFFRRVEFARDRAEDEQRKFGGCFGQHVGRVAEGDSKEICGLTIDVVKACRYLSDDLESRGCGLEYVAIDFVSKGGDERVHAVFENLNERRFGRRFGVGIDAHFVAEVSELVEGLISDVS